MMYKYALFDLDGTLLDTSSGVISSIRKMVSDESLPEIPDDILISFIGPPIENSIKSYYKFEDEKVSYLAGIFRKYYSTSEYLFQAEPYPGLYELLDSLKNNNIKIAVATNKRHVYAMPLLEHFGISQYCHVMHGSDNEKKQNKHLIILQCLEDLKVANLKECVLIGDTIHDAHGAKEAGIDFIGVTFGFGFKKGVDIPDNCIYLADTNNELNGIFINERRLI